MAWYAFTLKEFKIIIDPNREVAKIKAEECDNRWRTDCKNPATVCMSRTIAVFSIERKDHAHVCNGCAEKLRGTTKSLAVGIGTKVKDEMVKCANCGYATDGTQYVLTANGEHAPVCSRKCGMAMADTVDEGGQRYLSYERKDE